MIGNVTEGGDRVIFDGQEWPHDELHPLCPKGASYGQDDLEEPVASAKA